MELHIKPKDKIYENLKHLIDAGQITLNVVERDTPNERSLSSAYGNLYNWGFLDMKKVERKRKKLSDYPKYDWTFLPGKYELLEDKTIVLYQNLNK